MALCSCRGPGISRNQPSGTRYSGTPGGAKSCVAGVLATSTRTQRRLPSPLLWVRPAVGGGGCLLSRLPALPTSPTPPAVLLLATSALVNRPLSGIYSGSCPEWLAPAPAPAGLLLMQSRGTAGLSGGRLVGTFRATAGPGCRPFLSPRSAAAAFRMGWRTLLPPFGGAGTSTWGDRGSLPALG